MKIRSLLLPAVIAAALTVLIAPAAFAQQDPQADKKAEDAKKTEDAKKAEARKKADAEKKKSGDRGVEPEEEGDK
ncbi:hypothetical protein [Lysobacter capsici]|jgi:hypothetical protein|uniref:hypothetical protein n=1 Tax=Lysobacter capsici TaxID=435897 RepID=UPI00287B8206|nr:hypothetical protein [Lysobacter capsici]WND78979.1 hypothetical protein RJ610_16930 [Lysobacter capsici]WND84174.1 hypothetical protein RJ609_16940 [Lysobacter capsici]